MLLLTVKGGKLKRSISEKKVTAAVYARLSRDDDLDGESNSIRNQKQKCAEVATSLGYTDILYYVDDGISGMVEQRPAFQKLITDIKSGKIGAVICKDQSRLSRDIVVAHKFIELCVDFEDVRLVAVADGFDSYQRVERAFIGFRSVMNESYAEDISKKCRMAIQTKGTNGAPIGKPPYGYMANPDIKPGLPHWIVDDDAAYIVQRIFSRYLDGKGTAQIAADLEVEGVLTPMNYAISKGINKGGKCSERPSKWNSTTILKILGLREYCGDIINFKTYTKSYRNKKKYKNDNPVVFKDVHEPIISREQWEKVQAIRRTIKKRKTRDGERNIFSGILFCNDCGNKLGYHFNQTNPDIKYFNCSAYNKRHRECEKSHYVRADFLEKVVLGEFQRLTKFVSKYSDSFEKAVRGFAKDKTEFEVKRREKDLKAAQGRSSDIDIIIQKLYEDKVGGLISNERFTKLSTQYEQEQTALAEKVSTLQVEIQQEAERAQETDVFLAAVKKYSRISKLTQQMLYDLVDRIEIHQAQKIDGITVQHIDIYYHCIGSIEIPDILPIPETDVQISTRQGITLKYGTK